VINLKISIVTAVWNREATLSDALDSLAAQTYGNYEHVVQDGGSTDGTLSLLAARPDDRRRLISEEDNGIYDALNRAIRRSSGDVVGLLHSDDFFAHPNVLEWIAQRFNDPDVDAVYGDLDYVSSTDTSQVIRRWRSGVYEPRKLRRGWMPPHPTLFLRREVFDKYGLYDTSLRIAADYDAVLRYLVKGQIRPAYISRVLVKMRMGGESNRSLERIILKSREDLIAMRNNGVGGFTTLFGKNFTKIGQFF